MTESTPRYDRTYYEGYFTPEGSIPYERSDHWISFFGGVGEEIARRLHPRTTLDAGCAHGFLVEALVAQGVDARGFDVSDFAVSQAHESIRDRVWVGSLTEPIEGRYDLVTCIEVIEHVPSSEAGLVVKRLADVTDTVLLSSTPEDFEEPTHLNVQPPEYWAELFAACGFYRDLAFDATFLSPWAVLYRRRPGASLPAVVRDFERESWRLRAERDRLRQAFLQLSQGGPGDSEAHRANDQLRSELRVAIDAAHAADAERATALARLRAVEIRLDAAVEREKEFVDLLARIDLDTAEARHRYQELLASPSFRLFSTLMRPYRRLNPRRR
jgi:hypothetical protein